MFNRVLAQQQITFVLACRLTGQPHHSSYLTNSVTLRGHAQAVRTLPSTVTPALSTGVLVRGNVLVESYDTSTVMLGGHHGLIRANLALGTIKDMTGEQDTSKCLRRPSGGALPWVPATLLCMLS